MACSPKAEPEKMLKSLELGDAPNNDMGKGSKRGIDVNMKIIAAKQNDLIYDVGMHLGEDSEYYLKKGFRVIGFEADPNLAAYCRIKFHDAIEQKRLIIIEGAIVDSYALQKIIKVKFFRNTNISVWGTLYKEWARRNEILGAHSEIIEVNAIDFTECINKYGVPYYMKIDIEGADTICLKSLLDFDLKPDYVSIESEKVLFDKLVEEIKLLEQLGFAEFMAVQQDNIASTVTPNPSKEGIFVEHNFQRGSSGLFGKELLGNWKTKKEILREYNRIFYNYKLFGDLSLLQRFWFGRAIVDLLATGLRKPLPGWYDTHAKHSSIVLQGKDYIKK
jgi:FkbM family methyltransferase